jgi:hypothetical protein
MAKINISVIEGLGWMGSKLKEYALGAVPDAAKLEILTQRMREDRDQKRRLYHAALASELQIFNPDENEEGSLERLQNQLKKRNGQGEKWGAELTGEPKPTKARRAQLEQLLEACSADCSKLEGQIRSDEALLATRKETTALRKKAFDEASAELKKLEQIAPTILAQTQALKDAQRERLEAAADSAQGNKGQAGALIAQYEMELQEAQAGAAAATMIEIEETEGDVGLDAELDKEEAAAAADERIARWTKK